MPIVVIDGFVFTVTGYQLALMRDLYGGGRPRALAGSELRAAAKLSTLGLTTENPRDRERGLAARRYSLTDRGRALLRASTKGKP